MPSEHGNASGFQRPVKAEGGYYIVSWRDNYVHWLAWASWMYQEFDKRQFPERMTVWDEWPPITGEMAIRAVTELKAWRSEANKVPRLGPLLRELNSAPKLWEPWPADYRLKLERDESQRRQETDNKFDHRPRYAWEA